MHKNHVKVPGALTDQSREEKIAVLARTLDKLGEQMKNCQHCQKNSGCHGHKTVHDKLTSELEEIK